MDKFSEIFGTEVGNAALKFLPYGGIYLKGGVTAGIESHLLNNSTFMDNFRDKGRHSEILDCFKVKLINSSLEIGLLGCEEKGRRDMMNPKHKHPVRM